MQKLLITGATGFIGGFLTEAAVNNGYEVIVSVRKSSDLTYIKDLKVEHVSLDFTSIASMVAKLSEIKPDFIIHNAGLTKSDSQNQLDTVNANFPYNLALAATQSGIVLKKFVYLSSLASYGPADQQSDDMIREMHSPKPITMYGQSKLKAEKLLKSIDTLPYIILRPTAVYGPREKDLFTVFKMVSNHLALHSGNGKQQLTFIYISDLISLILQSLTTSAVKKSYFVSDGQCYSPTQLNHEIAKNLGVKTIKIGLPLPVITVLGYISEAFGKLNGHIPSLNRDKVNEIKAKNWRCEIEELVKDMQYTPKVMLEEGVKMTVKWYKENNWL